jgi:UDP-glucose 4-epimerase
VKAFVTGGSGFLGRYIAKELLVRGFETVIYDKFLPDPRFLNHDLAEKASFVQGDILERERLGEAMEGADLVFHTAAIAEIDKSRLIPVTTMEVNVLGTTHCLQAALDCGVDRFLFASSVYVSGGRGSFYRISKQAGESLCKSYQNEFGLEYTILRYGSLYGREANHWNFIYTVCRELLTTGKFHYTSSPEALREYIHIQDAARETVRIALDAAYANKVVLITGHQRMKMREFFDMVEEILGRKITVTYADSQQSHYIRTPYSFIPDVPLRINLSTYVDISEGILDCLKEVQQELDGSSPGENP